MRHDATLTVGYDGSPCSVRAVRWALDAATSHDATVRVVACYDPILTAEPWFGRWALPDPNAIAVNAGQRVADFVAGLPPRPGVTVEYQASVGPPAQQLVAEATGTDLLVVGNTGHRTIDA